MAPPEALHGGADPVPRALMPLVEFIRRTTAQEDSVLAALRSEIQAAGMPAITPEAGKMLQLLVRASGAKRVLEVGTGFGYSAIWLARGLPPDGQLRTVELDPRHAKVAEQWVQRAGLGGKVQVVHGKAVGVLPALPTKFFDLVFIDADKESYPRYWELALRLTRPGGLICADNVFWFGAALGDHDTTPDAEGIRAYNRLASSTPGVETLILPLGDGLSVSLRT
jgi:predicted O-methyltransferase YrrM